VREGGITGVRDDRGVAGGARPEKADRRVEQTFSAAAAVCCNLFGSSGEYRR
jgi:hypothetical protein